MTVYVLGFCRDLTTSHVLLIRKRRPDWQAGLLNGVGGRMEESDASAEDAMEREFLEETGVTVPAASWRLFCELSGPTTASKSGAPDWMVFCLKASWPLRGEVGQPTDEEPVLVPIRHLPDDTIDNLKWLVPMAFAASPVHAVVDELRSVT